MAILLNDNISTLAPKPYDERFGPYDSVASALTSVPKVFRYKGLTLGVTLDGTLKEYWFPGGIEDTDFVEKMQGGRLPPDHVFFLQVGTDTSEVSVGANQYVFRMPFSGDLYDVLGSLTLASNGSNLVVDIVTEGGVSIFSSPLTIESGVTSSDYSAVPYDPVINYFRRDDPLKVNVLSVGSSFPGTGLKVYLSLNEAGMFCTPSSVEEPSAPPYSCNTGVNTFGVTDFTQAWFNCPLIGVFPCIDASSGVTFSEAWKNCSNMVYFPYLDLSAGVDFSSAWSGCSSLLKFPSIDVGFGEDFSSAWFGCSSLTSFPELWFSSGTNFNSSWSGCSNLQTFPPGLFDNCLATDFENAWSDCALDMESVNGILISLDAAGQSNGTVHIDGGTSSYPSGIGLAAAASLIARGWNVYYNAPPPCDSPPYLCSTAVNPYCVTDFTSAWAGCTGLTLFPVLDVWAGTIFDSAWQGCTGLTSFPTLDFSSATSFVSAWEDCTGLTSFPSNSLDNCTATNFTYAWRNCALSQEDVDNILVSLDAKGGTGGTVHIDGGTSSNPSAIGLVAQASLEGKGWTVVVNTNVNTTCSPAYPGLPVTYPPYYCDTVVNTAGVTDFYEAWNGCNSIVDFPCVDSSSVTNFAYAWQRCTSMETFPNIDTSQGQYFNYSWAYCYALNNLPALNCSSGTDFTYTWSYIYSLPVFPNVDVSNGITFYNTWGGSYGITEFPALNMSSAEDLTYAWFGCEGLISFPAIDFSSVTSCYRTWDRCYNLESFPANVFDTCLCTDFYAAWNNCSLDQTSVDNILVSLDTAGQSNGIVHLTGGNAAPGSAGLAAKSNLISRGWTVYTN